MIVVAPAPALASDTGWQVSTTSTTLFIGDWLNVTITPPPFSSIGFVHANLTDANGSIIDEWYLPVVNGTANFSYEIPLYAEPGNFLFNASVLSDLIAQIGFTVAFDNEIFQDRRIALLERDMLDLSARYQAQRLENRELRAQVNGFWWLVPLAVFVLFIIGLALQFVIIPHWQMWVDLNLEFDPAIKKRARVLLKLANFHSPSELAEHHRHLRLIKPDPWARARLAARLRSYPLSPKGPSKLRVDPADRRTWGRH